MSVSKNLGEIMRSEIAQTPDVFQNLSNKLSDENIDSIPIFDANSFETFKYFESEEFKINSMKECLYKAIEKSTLSQEKILADYFDTNLGKEGNHI